MASTQNQPKAITGELAGVTADILCRFPKNYDFLLPYRTDKAPQFTVEITPEDNAFSLSLFARFSRKQNKTYKDASGYFPENRVCHRLAMEKYEKPTLEVINVQNDVDVIRTSRAPLVVNPVPGGFGSFGGFGDKKN